MTTQSQTLAAPFRIPHPLHHSLPLHITVRPTGRFVTYLFDGLSPPSRMLAPQRQGLPAVLFTSMSSELKHTVGAQ